MSGRTKRSQEEGHDGGTQEGIDYMAMFALGTCPPLSKSLFLLGRKHFFYKLYLVGRKLSTTMDNRFCVSFNSSSCYSSDLA